MAKDKSDTSTWEFPRCFSCTKSNGGSTEGGPYRQKLMNPMLIYYSDNTIPQRQEPSSSPDRSGKFTAPDRQGCSPSHHLFCRCQHWGTAKLEQDQGNGYYSSPEALMSGSISELVYAHLHLSIQSLIRVCSPRFLQGPR